MKLLISLLALVAATGAVAAAEFMVCPPWEIMVVDEAGKPMAGCAVVQEWGSDFQNVYVTGTTNAVTDAEGRVRFPSRHIGPPPGESGWRKLGRAIDRRPEGSPAAMAIVSKPGYRLEWIHARGDSRNVTTKEGLRGLIVLKPEKPG